MRGSVQFSGRWTQAGGEYREVIESFQRRVADFVRAQMDEQAAQLERDLTDAMTMQDFGYLERLEVVYVHDFERCVPPAVASRWIDDFIFEDAN